MLLGQLPEPLDRPYRRWIEDSGLSLEANTPSTPTTGAYYVFQEGVVCFTSEDLDAAREVFDRLGMAHWEAMLTSHDPQQRLDGARGLFRHDLSHDRALEVLTADGSDQDRRRIAQARHRAQYEERRARSGASREPKDGSALPSESDVSPAVATPATPSG
jgi:hypothetical protein